MTDQRAADTLAWLDAHAADVAAHPGAAYAEVEILRALMEAAGPQSGGLLAHAYEADLLRRIPSCNTRAEVRGLAHALMFASNFGRIAIVVSEGYGALLDALVAEYAEDVDTLGELLISAHILSHNSSAITAARAMFDGSWAALPRENFATSYHAVLVGGILYAITS